LAPFIDLLSFRTLSLSVPDSAVFPSNILHGIGRWHREFPRVDQNLDAKING